MKIRNHRKRIWRFYPSEKSKLEVKEFKYKSKLMRFLNSNLGETLNGEVSLYVSAFGSSETSRLWSVWCNQNTNEPKIKAVLKQTHLKGKKYVFKPSKIPKDSKLYFAFSDKVISLMCHLKDNDGIISPNKAKNLVTLFKKRGFKDFEPTHEDWCYIDYHIKNGIDFYYWSDRCNWLRTKTVIEYFNRRVF